MANTVRFIRRESRIKEEKQKGKAGLQGLHCGVYKHTCKFAFVLGGICAARNEQGCREVCASLMHASGFLRVQPQGRERWGLSPFL